MKKLKIKITSYERNILRVLLKRKSLINTTKVSKITGMSWNTARKYLQKMYKRGWLSKKGNSWRARR